MTSLDSIDLILRSARPRAVGALLRYFRDLDSAEEAYQEACLAALKHWPKNGPPRDAAAWLIFVGRNAALDANRRQRKLETLPAEELISDQSDRETALLEQLDGQHYRDDILRLLFICCHPDLPMTQQLALALRIVCGLSVKQIARAFIVSEAAMEQRITRAKSRIGDANVPFESPGPEEREERLAAVASAIYLMFNEGYAATGGEAALHTPLCAEAIRLGRLLLGLFEDEPEILGLLALMLLQHSRAEARLDADGCIVLLEAQDRRRWDRALISEALALLDAAMQRNDPGPYQVQAAIAALHVRPARAEDTDWTQIELLYATLEQLVPSPVIRLNRAVAVAKVHGAAAALSMIEPLAEVLAAYFYFHGLQGSLLRQLGRDAEARAALSRAIALANTPAEAFHIRAQLDCLLRTEPRQ